MEGVSVNLVEFGLIMAYLRLKFDEFNLQNLGNYGSNMG